MPAGSDQPAIFSFGIERAMADRSPGNLPVLVRHSANELRDSEINQHNIEPPTMEKAMTTAGSSSGSSNFCGQQEAISLGKQRPEGAQARLYVTVPNFVGGVDKQSFWAVAHSSALIISDLFCTYWIILATS